MSPPKETNFFIALDSMLRKTANFVDANIFGPALRSIQWINKKSIGSDIIICDWDTISARLAARIGLILSESDDPNSTIFFSVCFDGTKVPPNMQLLRDTGQSLDQSLHAIWFTSVDNLMNPSRLFRKTTRLRRQRKSMWQLLPSTIRALGYLLILSWVLSNSHSIRCPI